MGWTVLSLQQEGAWVSLWDGGREVSGRQISVSTYYRFLVMIVCWFCMFVGVLIVFLVFFFYLLLLSNIPSLPFYLVRTIF